MTLWTVVMPILALAALTALVYRITLSTSKRTRDILLSLLTLFICLLINTPELYESLDGLLGAKNFTYLAVQITWCLFLHLLASAILCTRAKARLVSLVLLLATVATQLVSSIALSGHSATNYRILDYREAASAATLTMSTNIYSALVAVLLAIHLLRSAVSDEVPRQKTRRVGFALTGTGLLIGDLAAVERILFANSTGTHLFLDGSLVLSALVLILLGLISTFVDVRRHRSSTKTQVERA